MARRLVRGTAAALLLGAAVAAGCDHGSGGSAARGSATTTALSAPATPSFAVGDLAAVDQCALLTTAEAGALLHRPATFAHQETMGNHGTCTVQASGAPLALVQWNVGVAKVSAAIYTRWLAGLVGDLKDDAAPQGCRPFGSEELAPEGLGDGAWLLSCVGPSRVTQEVVASTGGHELVLRVTRAPDPAAADPGQDVVAAARLLVGRLPR